MNRFFDFYQAYRIFAPDTVSAEERPMAIATSAPNAAQQWVETLDLVVYLDRNLVTLHGRPISLDPPEYRLMQHLARNLGEPIRQMDLLEVVYGSNATSLAIIERLLHSTRHKLGPLIPQHFIETVPRKGVRLRKG